MNDTRIDAIAAGRFELGDLLGAGATGTVYRGFDRQTGNDVAIKLLHPHLEAAESRHRLQREIALVETVLHPNIVRLYEVVSFPPSIGLVMELLAGGSLRQALQRGPLPSLQQSVGWLRDIAAALAAAHGRVLLHRDVKPQNVLLTADHAAAKLADFGLAFSLGEAAAGAESTRIHAGEHALRGTPLYMAPEVFRGDFYDPRSDLYSLGVVAYEMLTGRPPFLAGGAVEIQYRHRTQAAQAPSALRADLPKRLDELVLACLEKRPEDRVQTAQELGEELAAIEAIGCSPAAPRGVGLPGRRRVSGIRGRPCPSCGESIPPQLSACPWCTSRPFASLGRGRYCVVLEPPIPASGLRTVLEGIAGDLPGLYPLPVNEAILEAVAVATGQADLDREEGLRRLHLLPCLLVARLDREDAAHLVARISAVGGRARIRRYFRYLAWGAALPGIRHIREAAALGPAGVGIGGLSLAAVAIGKAGWRLAIEGLRPEVLTDLIIWCKFVPVFAMLLLYGVYRAELRLRRPLAILVDGAGSRIRAARMPPPQAVLQAARCVLPTLEDRGIRRITVSAMAIAARLRERAQSETWAAMVDRVLVGALGLALAAQQAREEHHLAGGAQAERGLRAFSRLVGLRARLDRLLALVELGGMDQNLAAGDLDRLLREVELEAELVAEVRAAESPGESPPEIGAAAHE
ncbi:MAG: serine/threonine protein kinase [Candidatus Schekmanbacteria bacterium]|nr:serine/threonine protein kinase [Candidatus Schekmanbacteria bacterium]